MSTKYSHHYLWLTRTIEVFIKFITQRVTCILTEWSWARHKRRKKHKNHVPCKSHNKEKGEDLKFILTNFALFARCSICSYILTPWQRTVLWNLYLNPMSRDGSPEQVEGRSPEPISVPFTSLISSRWRITLSNLYLGSTPEDGFPWPISCSTPKDGSLKHTHVFEICILDPYWRPFSGTHWRHLERRFFGTYISAPPQKTVL
jgi:hypothetical protein